MTDKQKKHNYNKNYYEKHKSYLRYVNSIYNARPVRCGYCFKILRRDSHNKHIQYKRCPIQNFINTNNAALMNGILRVINKS